MATVSNQGGSIHIASQGADADVNIAKGSISQDDGGVITVSSERDIKQNGALFTKGMVNTNDLTGGTITLFATNKITNAGHIEANGNGLANPAITLAANEITNTGGIVGSVQKIIPAP